MRFFRLPAFAALAASAALIGGVPACFPDFALPGSGDGGPSATGPGSDGGPGSSSGGPTGNGDGSPGTSGNDATVPLDDSGNPIPTGDSALPTLADGAPITGDGGSTTFDPARQIVVPHGSFTFEDSAGVARTLAHLTNDTLFDKYEITTAQFDAWVNAAMPVPADGQSLDPGGPYDGHMYWQGGNTWSSYAASLTYKDPNCYTAQALETSQYDTFGPTYPMYLSNKTGPAASYPINCVNYYQAIAYCWWDGHKRLATEVEYEWEITGLGRGYTYPWGNSPAPDCSLALWRGDGGTVNNYNGCGWPKPVGSSPAGKSYDGVLDMQGSVEEWMWNVPSSSLPPEWTPNYAGEDEDAGVDLARTARGGSFYTTAQYMTGGRYDYFSTPQTTQYADLGIRCVKSRL